MALSSLGPYCVLEPLGAGANGRVFLAEDTRLHRRVAIKTLIGTAGADGNDLRRRMLREARAAARLNDPHIAAVYDVLESDEGVHIVMEYVQGSTLAFRVRQGPLAPIEVLNIALQLTEALLHAHSLGVIHRDLKPANIVLSPQGKAKILDFGLARLQSVDVGSASFSSSDSTSVGEGKHTVGTPPYMPPEHLRGAPVDERGDIYSLGVTLFELLTGRRPFEASGRVGLTEAILTAPTPAPRSFSPDVPLGFDAVVTKAMARDPRDRYGSAGEMISDLERLRSEITDPSTRSHRRARSVRPTSRAAMTVAAVLAILVAVAGVLRVGRLGGWGLAGTAGAAPGAAGPNVVAVLPLAGAVGDPQTESLATGVADSLITTLSKVPGVTVVSRAATLKYRERKLGPDAIARELGATLLVDGGLQRVGDRLRITVSLLPVGTNVVRWQGAYDGNFGDLFTLQAEAAEAVARAVAGPSADTQIRRPAATAPDVEAVADAAQARAFLERPDVKDNVDRAIELFQAAIRKDARYARAHAGLGEALWRKFQDTREDSWSTRARDEINEALRLDPDDISVRYSLAAVYKGMGRIPEAIEELRRIATVQPSSDDAHRLLGQLLAETGHQAEAEAEIRKAISLHPNYWAHYYALGQVYYRADRYREAIAAFQRVTELQPDNAWGHQMLGVSYHALNDTAAAIPHYQKAIELGNGSAYSNLGTIYARQGKAEEAERCYKQAIKLAPTAQKYHNLGDLYATLGRTKDADAQYTHAAALAKDQLRGRPGDLGILIALAMVEAKLGHAAEAAGHIKEAIALAPDNSDVLFSKAIVDSRAGRTEDALTALGKALEHGYSPARAAEDPDLASLRGNGRFAALLRIRVAKN